MSLPRSPYRPYLGVVHRPILQLLRLAGLSRLTQRWIRVSNPNYSWPLQGRLQGHVMQLSTRDDFQYLEPNYEPLVCSAIERLIRPGYVCADIGAHLGYMTLLMSKLVGSKGRVFSFEALPENAWVLEQNVAHNGYQSIVDVENRAASDRTVESCTMYRGRTNFESTLVPNENSDSFTVPATALDDYFAYRARLDFIKMDIEGAEVKAMVGMRKVLSRTRPTILLEVHEHGWPATEQLVESGYLLFDLQHQPTSANDMRLRRLNHCVAVPKERA